MVCYLTYYQYVLLFFKTQIDLDRVLLMSSNVNLEINVFQSGKDVVCFTKMKDEDVLMVPTLSDAVCDN